MNPASGDDPRRDPALDRLIAALTAAPDPHALTGRAAAAAAFRAAAQTRSRPAARRPLVKLRPARLMAAAASVLTLLAGLTAAAAAQALPTPVERLADTVLAPLGVPVSHRNPTHPRPHHPHALSSRSAAGSALKPSASHVPGSPAASIPDRTPHSHTRKTPAIIRPALRLAVGEVDDYLTVFAPSAIPGNTIRLTEWTGTAWLTLAARRLTSQHTASFTVRAGTAAAHLFRADLPQSPAPAARTSNTLKIPPRTPAAPPPTPAPTATASPDASAAMRGAGATTQARDDQAAAGR